MVCYHQALALQRKEDFYLKVLATGECRFYVYVIFPIMTAVVPDDTFAWCGIEGVRVTSSSFLEVMQEHLLSGKNLLPGPYSA